MERKKLLYLINTINEEISHTQYINLNNVVLTLAINLSKDKSISESELIDYIFKEICAFLVNISDSFKVIVDNDSYREYFLNFVLYIKNITRYYINMMSLDKDKFDRYVEISSGSYPSEKIITSENLYMSIDEIQNTMHMLNEAVRNYYEFYYQKRLITTFSDDEVIEFKIKESELAHVLGVSLKKIVDNPSYVDLFHITQSEVAAIKDYHLDPLGTVAINVLLKIVDISDGNLLQYEEDRLRKMVGHEYSVMPGNPGKTLRTYSKIHMRAKSFIDFRPLEKLSLALNLPSNYRLIRQNNESNTNYSLLVSKNRLSNKFKYSNLIANYDESNNRRYFQSLFLSTPEQMKELMSVSIPSISMKVELETDEGTTITSRVFTREEHLEFLNDVQNDINDINTQELINYFNNINGFSKIKRF